LLTIKEKRQKFWMNSGLGIAFAIGGYIFHRLTPNSIVSFSIIFFIIAIIVNIFWYWSINPVKIPSSHNVAQAIIDILFDFEWFLVTYIISMALILKIGW